MTFADARAISKTGLHIRRAAWDADKWFIVWRGTWFCFGTGLLVPVRAADYNADDLNAEDWTTVPAALAACPITPSAPIGGGPPAPGSPSFPSDPLKFPPFPGQPSGGSPSGGPPSLPPPNDDAGSVTVTLDGTATADFTGTLIRNLPNIDGGTVCTRTGPNTWSGDFTRGYEKDTLDDDKNHDYVWDVTAVKSGAGIGATWSVSVVGNPTKSGGATPSGGFTTSTGATKGNAINNATLSGGGNSVFGGTARVS